MNNVQNIINNSGGELRTTYPFSDAYKNTLSENAQKDSNPELTNDDPINDPKNVGIIRRVGSVKSGHWEIVEHAVAAQMDENIKQSLTKTVKTKKIILQNIIE